MGNISIYCIFIILAFLINIIISILYLKNVRKFQILLICLIEDIGIIVGAKILDIVIYLKEYIFLFNSDIDLLEIAKKVFMQGYIFYGGFFGAMISLLICSKIFKIKILKLFNILIPNLILFYGIAKIGCYFNECCKGIYIENKRIPIQLIESMICFCIYLYIFLKGKGNNNCKNKMVPLSLLFYSLLRFTAEFLRDTESKKILFLTVNQAISLPIIVKSINLLKKGDEKCQF
ncbi:MAG: prolipoprotein diacylglyceryl transferase [Clostridia bacterium]|nr:prolipoprotein diacylglyceryl transferase [Clostridia bacterium]